MKNNKGITLIALVITIIVLLILAGITIAMLAGENGILTNATKSKAYDELGTAKDQIALKANEAVSTYFTTHYVGSNADGKYTDAGVADAVKNVVVAVNIPSTVSITSAPAANSTDTKIAYDFTLKSGDYSVVGHIGISGSLSWDDITK